VNVQAMLSEPDREEHDGVRFGIDWFAFTVKGSQRTFILERLVEAFGDPWRDGWEVVWRGGRRERTKGAFGTLVEIDWSEKWVHVQIKGKGCRAVGVEALIRLHELLWTRLGDAYVVKRVDLAWDDHRKRMTPGDFRVRFWDAGKKCKRPEVVCKARGGHAREDDGPDGGGSYTVGKRTSKRMLRVYDKRAESGGKVDAIRFELECKEKVAADAMQAMSGAVGNRSAAALRFLVGFIDFREVAEGKSVRERRRTRWWAEFVGDAKKAKLSRLERKGLEEWRAVYTKQNSSGFRLLVHLCGGELRAAAVELLEANVRDNPQHRAWHEQLREDLRSRRSDAVQDVAVEPSASEAPSTPVN
jgi:hypothetical protein